MAPEAWEEKVLQRRARKDEAFRGDDSPLMPEAKVAFEGLSYYAPDAAYRGLFDLEKEEPVTLKIPRTGGDEAVYERVGVFRIPLPAGDVTVAALDDGRPHVLFIPFRDATSGKETYGAGRYLEVHETKSGRWLIDFNNAYHPFCAYNEEYTCPLPPIENWLKVPVEAGERMPAPDATTA